MIKGGNQQKKIIHIDMDAFYVSVEIRDNPTLQGKAVAVGGKSDRRGVIATCNYEARKLGVRSAMATAKALQQCPELIIVPGRMNVYQEISKQIRVIFSHYTNLIEPLSLDEAYLDVSDCECHQNSATLIAQDIRAEIYKSTGLTASAGIAPLKFLAKIASDENKPNGQFVIAPNEVIPFIEKMPLHKISGVGKVTQIKLKKMGLFTGMNIRQSTEKFLIQQLGSFGGVLWQRCQGIDEREINTSHTRRTVGVERTFSVDISDIGKLKQLLHEKLIPELIGRAEHHLKSQVIAKLGIKLKFADFILTTKEFKHQVLDTKIFELLLDEAFQRGQGKSVRLLGVHIGLAEQGAAVVKQLDLF